MGSVDGTVEALKSVVVPTCMPSVSNDDRLTRSSFTVGRHPRAQHDRALPLLLRGACALDWSMHLRRRRVARAPKPSDLCNTAAAERQLPR